jgi:tripartite-type tricarboxylate transporter receptor subunit TctC
VWTRRFACASALALSTLFSASAHAQLPSRIVTIVVPYAAGGGTDAVARLIGEKMSGALGRTVIVENVVGAGGTIANDRVARSTPDGTTILINHTALLSAPSLFSNLRYETRTAFQPIGLVNIAPLLLVGRKTIPGSGPKDFVAWMKEQGAKLTFAHGGVGTNTQLCAVLIGNVLGFKPVFAAYRGSGPALTDLVAGQIDLICDQATSALPQVQAGLLHGIAVTSTARLEQAPDIPTAAEVGLSNLVYTFWHGLYVPKGTPKETVAALNAALRAAVSDPGVRAKLKAIGTEPFPDDRMSPEAHAALFAEDLDRITKLVESSGLKPSEAK